MNELSEEKTQNLMRLFRSEEEQIQLQALNALKGATIPEILESIILEDDCLLWKALQEGLPIQHSRIKQLNVSSCLSEKENTVFKKLALKNLRKLDISYNQLNILPLVIRQWDNLEELDAAYNQLTKIVHVVPQLKKLKVLAIHDNQLEELPPSIGQLENLEELYLSENRLKEIPVEIAQLKKLRILDISHNPDLCMLPRKLEQLKNLQELYVSKDSFYPLPSWIVASKKINVSWVYTL